MVMNKSMHVSAYKAGYSESHAAYLADKGAENRGVYYLEKDKREQSEQLDRLLVLFGANRCPDAGASRRNYYNLYLEYARAAELLAEIEKSSRFAVGFRERAESVLRAEDSKGTINFRAK